MTLHDTTGRDVRAREASTAQHNPARVAVHLERRALETLRLPATRGSTGRT